MFMDFKFSKDSGDSHQQEAPDDKRNQSALLVLLLLLVGGFAYIYFFTGLIKPQEIVQNAAAPPPAAQPQIVKIPLPAREGESAKPDVKSASKSVSPAATAPVPAAVKPAPLPTNQTQVAAKPAVPSAKAAAAANPTLSKEEMKKTETAKLSEKKGIAAKTGAKKSAASGQAKSVAAVTAKQTVHGPWTLIVGNYVLEEALSADMGRIRKAGFKPVVKASTRIKSAMNRLLVAEFSDRASAQPTLEKLKRQTSDAFVIKQGDKFTVFAGSYLQNEAANGEKKRLLVAGFPVTIIHTNISIPSQSLSIGPFSSRKTADSALARLRDSGIKASLSQK
jgi:cell division septation protein DedD